MENNNSAIDYLNTPIGWLEIVASEKGISRISFVEKKTQSVKRNAITNRCIRQLKDYFDGCLKNFDLPLDVTGTDFQQSVWQQLTHIAFGHSASYRDIAVAVDNPKAVRAVGTANGCNPISIVVPCHRVIGSNGTLTGYAGGLERKQWLLEHEGVQFKSLCET